MFYRYVDVILPLPTTQYYTYRVPKELDEKIMVGMRITVPLIGRAVMGIVVRLHNEQKTEYRIKDIISIVDNENSPSILNYQIELIEWIARYYLSSYYDVMRTLLPILLRKESGKGYKPKYETLLRLADSNEQSIETILNSSGKEQQKEAIREYCRLSTDDDGNVGKKPVSKRLLKNLCSPSSVETLIKRGHIEEYRVEIGRLPEYHGPYMEPNILTIEQESAYRTIKEQFRDKNVVLLYGVTGSGKTDIYIKLIKETIESGKQVLYLLPEIALSTQILFRLQQLFGNDMALYHSLCSDNIRAEIWNRQLGDNPIKIILGTRSAIMLPFQNLGLVIVDEEHENSYKQEDPAPRYSGRNMAIVLAGLCGAKTILGSATPSVESYANSMWGKYGLVTLKQRFGGVDMPKIEIVDINKERKRGSMHGALSDTLIEAIQGALSRREQVILFHNRRGYSTTIECKECGWIQKCDRCDVSLTLHKSSNRATCHYCGRSITVAIECPTCHSKQLLDYGYGTEKIEEQIQQAIPEAKIARIDSDTPQSKYGEYIKDFQDGNTNVLIGTQMISKGFDFNNVSTVGIIDTDSIMGQASFRAKERCFQLLTQVVGRAGRRSRQGMVVLQTRQSSQPIIQQIQQHNYESLFFDEIQEREMFHYPPFSRLTQIKLRAQSRDIIDKAAQMLLEEFSHYFKREQILGPISPNVSLVNSMHIRTFLLKVDHKLRQSECKKSLEICSSSILKRYPHNSITISFDVDPL